MTASDVIDVFTVPQYRSGPSVLGLFVIGLLFMVPGLVAPIGVLQLVGLVWWVAAAAAAVRDVLSLRRRTAS